MCEAAVNSIYAAFTMLVDLIFAELGLVFFGVVQHLDIAMGIAT
jgi:hypothetical protein